MKCVMPNSIDARQSIVRSILERSYVMCKSPQFSDLRRDIIKATFGIEHEKVAPRSGNPYK